MARNSNNRCLNCGGTVIFNNNHLGICPNCETIYRIHDGYGAEVISKEGLFNEAVELSKSSNVNDLNSAIDELSILGDYRRSADRIKTVENRRDYYEALRLFCNFDDASRNKARVILSNAEKTPVVAELIESIEVFDRADDVYKSSNNIIKLVKARESLEPIRDKFSVVKKLYEKLEKKLKMTIIKKSIMATVAIVFGLILPIIIISSIVSAVKNNLRNRYDIAKDYYNAYQYEEAEKAFRKLGSYRDSRELRKESKELANDQKVTYQEGLTYFEEKEYEKALPEFCILAEQNYKDSDSYVGECLENITLQAKACCESGNYDSAQGITEKIRKYDYTRFAPSYLEGVNDVQTMIDNHLEEQRLQFIASYIETANEKTSRKDYAGAREALEEAKELYGEAESIAQEELFVEREEFLGESSQFLSKENIPAAAGLVADLSPEVLNDEKVSERADAIRESYRTFIKMNVESVIYKDGVDAALKVVSDGLSTLPGDSGLLELRGKIAGLKPTTFDLRNRVSNSDSFYMFDGPTHSANVYDEEVTNVMHIYFRRLDDYARRGTCTLTYDIGGDYKSLSGYTYTGLMWRDYDELISSNITFIGDGRNLGTFNTNSHRGNVPISVDLEGVQTLQIVLESNALFWENDQDVFLVNLCDMQIEGKYQP